MASTSTWATTKTYPRLELINLQLKMALRRTCNISDSAWESIQKGIDNQWIGEISVYGFDSEKLCRIELFMQIDWDEYKLQLSAGKATVAIDERWRDDIAIEIDEPVRMFDKLVNKYSLSTKWVVRYVSSVDGDEINRKLGFVASEPIKWDKKNENLWETSIPELPELHIGLRTSD